MSFHEYNIYIFNTRILVELLLYLDEPEYSQYESISDVHVH